MPASEPALRIDALGRKCPMPIIMLARQIGQVPIGAVVEVLADDPAAKSDVPAWCRLKSHQFISTTPLQVGWAFLLQRSY